MTQIRKVALIGAGSIAPMHLGALKPLKGVEIAAVVDPNISRAEALARQAGGAQVFGSIEALLAEAKPDAAHVLTPPPFHLPAARPLLEAGVHVLLEKPLAQNSEECATLTEAARHGGASLAVNHNFTHHPSFVRARKMIASGRYGRLRRVQMRYAAPLRQMTSRQFGHWMFDSPRNLLLEQAVHPLSQVEALLGPIESMAVCPGDIRRPAEGIELVTDYGLDLKTRTGTAQLQIVLGASYPSWTLSLLCDDGVIEADIHEMRVVARRPHPSILPIDTAKRNMGEALQAGGAALTGLTDFAREILRLGPAADGFSKSFAGSVGAFHARLDQDESFVDPMGASLVKVCEDIARHVDVALPAAPPEPDAEARYDVAVLGGTGFIGQALVRTLLDEGMSVAVMARSLGNLPALFHDPRVGLFKGSISDAEAVRAVLSRCERVVNLAHGGGGATREAVAEAMVGGAKVVGEIAAETRAKQLLFISSSAALYLGDPETAVTMETPPDPEPDTRADYARAKVLAEHAMLELEGVPVTILRPAIVVGAGAPPFHSALGAYENETHCIGWNAGKNPLPFVLVEDVASAILACLKADPESLDGKGLNIVGDVRWSARRYTEELAAATGRPLEFHSSAVPLLMASEWMKWVAKKVAGRRGVPTPSSRDFKSRGMVAPIDTSGEKAALDWTPCADEALFRETAILPHADTGS